MTDQTTIDVPSESREGMYLTFGLGEEIYGIRILQVQEIIGLPEITDVPQSPPHVMGVINLRGKVLSVIDMRRRLGLETVEATEETCVIVVNTSGRDLGICVDRVCDVLDVLEEHLQETPTFGRTVDTSYINGMAKFDGTVAILLDIDKITTG